MVTTKRGLSPFLGPLRFEGDAPLPRPARGPVIQIAKQTVLLLALRVQRGRLLQERLRHRLQTLVPGQADHVMHARPITPGEHPLTAKPGVRPQEDPHLRPLLAPQQDQQFEDRPGVPGSLDIAGTQITHQKSVVAEDRQGQEAVVPEYP